MSSKNFRAAVSKRKVDHIELTNLKDVLEETPVDYLNADELDNADSSDEDSSVYSGLSEDEEEEDSERDDDDDDDQEEEEEEEDGKDSNDASDGEAVDEKNLKTSKAENSDKPASQPDEYEEDSSDEEDLRNTVGNIPMKWYEEYPHIGYDLDGKPILKPPKGDQLDNFLRRMENPEAWRTVVDPMTEQEVVLSDADVNAIQRLMQGRVPDASFEPYAPWVYWFSSEVMQTPLSGRPEHKRSFIPSKLEAAKVGKMLHSIKMGWMTKREPKKTNEPRKFYMIWDNNDKAEEMRRIENHIAAPKPKLPGHAESYNPPPEYLYNDQELKRYEELDDEPHRRKYNFIPQKFSSLRQVPAYDKFARERFERCLDLYLCPRARKMRLTIQPEDLVPQLPKPRDLQPFPTVCSLVFRGHTDMVRSISMDPSGQFFATGSDDHTVRIWEVATGRCMRKFDVEGVVRSVSWCPSSSLALVAAAVDQRVLLLNPGVGDKLVVSKTDELLKQLPDQGDYTPPPRVKAVVTWEEPDEKQWQKGVRVIISHFKQVKQVTWHGKGDYFACVLPEGAHRSVLIHQLSRRRSQIPFSKAKGLVQAVLFHPIRPYLFVATQRHVRIYNLMKQELSKKLMTGAKWVSSIAVHPAGDNIIVGTYDRRLQWFDLDLSTKPYQILRHHGKAIRAVAYHKRYPLFASGSDDASAIVCHGMVYNDLLQNPLIVPVKILRGHQSHNDFGVLDVTFHPYQPWLFTAGADSTVRLYT